MSGVSGVLVMGRGMAGFDSGFGRSSMGVAGSSWEPGRRNHERWIPPKRLRASTLPRMRNWRR